MTAPELPQCCKNWAAEIYQWAINYGPDKIPSVIIINKDDLLLYEKWLDAYYKSKGQYTISINNGKLKFKGIEIGLNDEVKPGECFLLNKR